MWSTSYQFTFYVTAVVALCGGQPHTITADTLDVSRIKDALVQQMRFEMYWWGRQDLYRQGETLPLRIASDGRDFVARVDDFELLSDGRRVAAFYKGRQNSERTWIVQSSRTPLDASSELRGDQWWSLLSPELGQANVIQATVTVPASGAPFIAENSATKERILDGIIGSMKQQLSWNLMHEREKVPPSVTLVIGEFNVEDPTAFVLVEEQGKVYEVYLHDPADPVDPRYKNSLFLAWPIEGASEDDALMRSKVRETGAPYHLSLAPESQNAPTARPK